MFFPNVNVKCRLQMFQLNKIEVIFKVIFRQREYLLNILIMHERHFHFHYEDAGRIQDHRAACAQQQKESESAACVLLKC